MHSEDIIVSQDFIDYRQERFEEYNQGKRSDRKFLMDLDAELYEWDLINRRIWEPSSDWRIDGSEKGWTYDVKFIQKYWNISRQSMVNILQQSNAIDFYRFCEWQKRPNRPLEANDEVTIGHLGDLCWTTVSGLIRTSSKEPFGFYSDVREAFRPKGTHAEHRAPKGQ